MTEWLLTCCQLLEGVAEVDCAGLQLFDHLAYERGRVASEGGAQRRRKQRERNYRGWRVRDNKEVDAIGCPHADLRRRERVRSRAVCGCADDVAYHAALWMREQQVRLVLPNEALPLAQVVLVHRPVNAGDRLALECIARD